MTGTHQGSAWTFFNCTHHNAHVDMDELMWEDHVSVVHTKEIDTYL